MLLLLLAATARAASASEPSRAGRVVKLLKELKANIERDAAAEEKIYNKYACWCDNTASQKASGIDQAKADIRSLSADILRFGGSGPRRRTTSRPRPQTSITTRLPPTSSR
jgi:hypothetical protein